MTRSSSSCPFVATSGCRAIIAKKVWIWELVYMKVSCNPQVNHSKVNYGIRATKECGSCYSSKDFLIDPLSLVRRHVLQGYPDNRRCGSRLVLSNLVNR